MTRAVIYARYSSDLQREASIEDQIEVCRRYASSQGWTIVETYADRAISGATAQRPGYQQMLADAAADKFDIVLAEALDRLSRKVAEVATLQETLAFHGVKLFTIATGEVTALLAGILGSVGQQFLLDLREKTKRGQLGRALQGKIPGGKAYGYRVLPGTEAGAGERMIVDHEAEIVRRIFRDYANGNSPRQIAKELNEEGIPGPEGRKWRDTTIRGQVDRGTGILNNALYVGRLEWNRCSYVKDPRTGRRVARVNPRDQWEVVEVSELRIIDDDLWNRVKERQHSIARSIARDKHGNALNRAHRQRFLLSGKLQCAHCGGAYTIVGKDRYGCSNRNRGQATCSNGKTIKRQTLEVRVLDGLKKRLVTPDLIALFITEFQKEIDRLTKQSRRTQSHLARDLAAVERKIAGILAAVEDGLYDPSMKPRLAELQAQKQRIQQRIESGTAEQKVVALHPNLHDLYARQVARLEEALNAPAIKPEAITLVQSLIERIVLEPDETAANGLAITIHGELAAILSACAAAEGYKKLPVAIGQSGSQLSVVAGGGFEPPTFRL